MLVTTYRDFRGIRFLTPFCDALSRLSPSLSQLQTNRSLAAAKEQTLIRDDGMVPGFVVEHRQS